MEFDVFVINDKPTLFLSEVFRKGKIVFLRDEELKVKFEMFKLAEVLEYNELMKHFDESRFLRNMELDEKLIHLRIDVIERNIKGAREIVKGEIDYRNELALKHALS